MLTTRQTHPVVAGLFTTFDRVGATPPKPVAAAHHRLVATTAAFKERPHPNADALPLAVLAAVEDGRDPATDATVQRIVTAQVLAGRHNLDDELAAILIDDLRDVVRTHTDGIVGAWRTPFDKAAADLTTALEVLGPLDLDDTATVVRKGPEATTAWTNATNAAATITAIHAGWLHLRLFLTGSHLAKPRRLLVVAPVDPATWLDRDLDGTAPDPWNALCNGLPLALSTPADVDALTAAIDKAAAHRVAQAEEEARDAQRPIRRAVVA